MSAGDISSAKRLPACQRIARAPRSSGDEHGKESPRSGAGSCVRVRRTSTRRFHENQRKGWAVTKGPVGCGRKALVLVRGEKARSSQETIPDARSWCFAPLNRAALLDAN